MAIMPAASPGETCGGICPDVWDRDELGEVTRDGEYHGVADASGDCPCCCSFDPLIFYTKYKKPLMNTT